MNDERLLVNPIKDPVEFIRAPFGKSIREHIRGHLCGIADHMAAITLLCEKYPWLLSEEDLQFLEDTWIRVDKIEIHNKNGKGTHEGH